ncbi:MAG: ClpXP protease specificity-enhancing factor [Xanthomonadales bacterium]|nr:ClpXP protease specificity-enhancing factor [Xanthomonadales bacterium]
MNSNKPYLLRALNEWILDNGLTPHLIVDVAHQDVQAPAEAVRDGKLVLNISPQATRQLEMGNEAVSFETRFGGKPHPIFLPMDAVMAIYARENGQGMMFARENDDSPDKPIEEKPKGPNLKIIK